jgi:hypothetical protein
MPGLAGLLGVLGLLGLRKGTTVGVSMIGGTNFNDDEVIVPPQALRT